MSVIRDGTDVPVDVVLDNVGGQQHVAAWRLLSPGGSLHGVSWASGEPAVFPPYATIGPPKSLISYLNEGPVVDDLAQLVRLVEAGRLGIDIGWHGPIELFAEVSAAMRDRQLTGKAIFDLRG